MALIWLGIEYPARPSAGITSRPLPARAFAEQGSLVVTAATVGFAIGVLLYWKPLASLMWPTSPNPQALPVDLSAQQALLIFIFLMCAQLALWFALAAPLVKPVKERFHEQGQGTVLSFALLLMLMAIILTPALLTHAYWGPDVMSKVTAYLPDRAIQLGVVFAIGFVALLFPYFRIYQIDSRARAIHNTARHSDEDAGTLLDLRRDLHDCLTTLSAMLVALIVVLSASSRFANALAATVVVTPATDTTDAVFQSVPSDGVIAYGLFLTLILALVYVPTSVHITRASRALVDAVCPLPPLVFGTPEEREIWTSRNEARMKLETQFELSSNPLATIQQIFVIMAPLVGSTLGAAIPFAT